MPPRTRSADPYRRRREAGAASREETRARLLRAADELFREQGYVATSVSAIAGRAGVSLQTLYLAWGNKRALLRAATDAAAVAGDLPLTPADWHAVLRAELAEDAGHAPDAARYLDAVSAQFVRIAQRTAGYWRMNREAAATDPEAAADWAQLVRARRETMAAIAAGLPARGRRPGVSTAHVADTIWALAGPEVWELLTTSGGYDPAEFEVWLAGCLRGALCR